MPLPDAVQFRALPELLLTQVDVPSLLLIQVKTFSRPLAGPARKNTEIRTAPGSDHRNLCIELQWDRGGAQFS